MERTADPLSINNVTSEHIQELSKLQGALKQIKYWKDRHNQFFSQAETLSEEGRWLLTFSVWFCEVNTRFNSIVESKYYTLEPKQTNESTFVDFIKLVQRYNRKYVTEGTEVHINRFLSLCDRSHFDFYLSLLSKNFTRTLPIPEVYNLLDMGCIDIQEIYGSIEMLHTSFSELSYPVSIMCIPDPDYRLSVFAREPKRTYSFFQNEGKLQYTKDIMTIDATFINTPRYTIVGYTDVRKIKHRRKTEEMITLIPLDYFDTFDEFRVYNKERRKGEVTEYKQRMINLKKFLDSNYTRQIHRTPMGFAETAEELTRQVFDLYPNEGSGYMVITDKDTARTGKSFAVPVMNTYGIIEDLWVDQGVARGFNVWFNGKLIQCPFPFTGANTTLLNSIDLVHQKMIEFTYIQLGDTPIYIGKRIDWEKIRWKNYRHKARICIEKCALCGGTESPHRRQGLCKACEMNIRTYYAKYGVDTWIPQTPKQRYKRFRSGWSYDMPMNIGLIFRDTFIEAREDGAWRFRWDAKRSEGYLKYLESKKEKE